jgi:hypothetical protein
MHDAIEDKIDGLIQTWDIVRDLLEKHGQVLLAIHKAVTAEPEGPRLGDILSQLITVIEKQNERLEGIETRLDNLFRRAFPN